MKIPDIFKKINGEEYGELMYSGNEVFIVDEDLNVYTNMKVSELKDTKAEILTVVWCG